MKNAVLKGLKTVTVGAVILLSILSVAAVVSFVRFIGSDELSGDPTYRSYSASAVDYNGDGFMDIYVVNYLRGNYLYKNNGDGTFSEVGEIAGVADEGKGVRSAWSDYDKDGDQDLFVVNTLGDRSRLYRNQGNGTFIDITLNAGFDIYFYNSAPDAEWGDYDLDGYPDLFVTQNGHLVHEEGLTNILYHNNGDGTFTDVTGGAGLQNNGPSTAASWGDYNRDAYPDLYITNFTNNDLDFPENMTNTFYRNNGDGTFTDITYTANAYDYLGGYEVIWGDYNNDGHQDIFVANLRDVLSSSPNSLFKNMGDQTFREVSIEAGVRATESTVGALWSDFDLDGYLDLLITNIETSRAYIFYKNNGDGTFTDVTEYVGLDSGTPGQWPVAADFNNDGYPDIFVPGVGSENTLYINQGTKFFRTDLTLAPVELILDEASEETDGPSYDRSSQSDSLFKGVGEVTNIVPDLVKVSWEPVDINDIYYIYFTAIRGEHDLFNPTAIADSGRDSWLIEGLAPDTIYYIRVYRAHGGTIYPNTSEKIIGTVSTSYASQVRPIFVYNCVMAGCHFYVSPQLDLTLGEQIEAADLINIASQELPDMNRITPLDSLNSYLFHKINGTHLEVGGSGERMPFGRIDPLRDSEISTIENWINIGANAN